MLRRKQVYIYDTESCDYKPFKPGLGHYFAKFGLVLGIACSVFVLSYFVAGPVLFKVKTVDLHQENETLLARLNDINGRIDGFDTDLNSLYEKDNALYLPIVGENLISSGRWKAGTGGSANFDKSVDNAAFKTSLRISSIQNRLDLLNTSLDRVHKKADIKEVELLNMPSILPVNGAMISGFGYRRHPVYGYSKFHEGLDFACQVGTPIYASGNGVVESAEYSDNGYGKNINIDHKNGFRTKYAHLSDIKVKPGQEVKRGQLIGYSGNTGLSSGPHLHYEISIDNVKTDPIDFVYMDLPPQEYRRLKLDEGGPVTKEAVKEKLVAPSMD